jgi:thymidylate kinase
MIDLTVILWRDIPTQVIAKIGRKRTKRQLSERFEQAVDRCAMKVDAHEHDSYLEEWRKDLHVIEGDDSEAALEAEVQRIEVEYDTQRLRVMVENGGWNVVT